jgi:branched-chain amino acid transport system permease protein
MNEITQPLPRAQATPAVSWFQFATRHRASIASLVVLVFPLVMPFTALAVNILIYGLYALGFNLVYGYLGLLSFGHAAPSCISACLGSLQSRSAFLAAC